MRRCARKIGYGLVAVVLTLSTAPAAQADDASFVNQAHALGFPQVSANLVSTAESACYFLSLNRNAWEVEKRIQRYTRVEPGQARQFFVLAVREYCPQFTGLVGT